MVDRHITYRHPSPPFYTINGITYSSSVNQDNIDDMKYLPVQDNDLFIATYPKSGTTWISEIVWQIFLNGKIDERPINSRVHFLEHAKRNYDLKTKDEFYKFYLEITSPRVFKVHLPYFRMPQCDDNKPKIIYVMRNPKDVAVSLYLHYKGFSIFEFDGSWDDFFELFIEGKVILGSWFDHVLCWWAHQDDQNILFLKYEDLKKNLPGAIQKVGRFLGKELSADLIERIASQTSFAAMHSKYKSFMDATVDSESSELERSLRNTNFFRKGEVGDWRNYFTEDQTKRFDELYEKRMAGKGLDIEFK